MDDMLANSVANVVEKLSDALLLEAIKSDANQGELLGKIKIIMERLKSEFEIMQAFLKQVKSSEAFLKAEKIQKDEVAEAWLKRVREVGEQTRKVIDEYTTIISGPTTKLSKALNDTFHDKSSSYLRGYSNDHHNYSYSFFSCSWVPKLIVLQNIAHQLTKIVDDLGHIKDMKNRWEVKIVVCNSREGLVSFAQQQEE